MTWGKAFAGRTPTELQRKLDGIAGPFSALKQLGMGAGGGIDGPADRRLFDVLSFTEGSNDDLVAEASGRIGRLVEVIRAVDAARVLKEFAEKAGLERAGLARLTVSPGNTGDVPLNDWIADLLSIYVKITKKKPGTSVGAPDRDNEGEAGGPLIRFLQTAGLPVNRWISENWPDIKEDELRQMEIPSSRGALGDVFGLSGSKSINLPNFDLTISTSGLAAPYAGRMSTSATRSESEKATRIRHGGADRACPSAGAASRCRGSARRRRRRGDGNRAVAAGYQQVKERQQYLRAREIADLTGMSERSVRH